MKSRYFKHPDAVIRLAVWLYVRYPLSLRQVEEQLSERGFDVNYETIRRWWNRFGPELAAEIRSRRRSAGEVSNWSWHLDEVYVRILGVQHYLWRAVDHECEVIDAVLTRTRDRRAATKLLRRLLKRHGMPNEIVTDGLRSYGAALDGVGIEDRQNQTQFANNRAENSHQPLRRRERAMQGFRSMKTAQKFSSIHGEIQNHFLTQRQLLSRANYRVARSKALSEWRGLCA